MLPALTVTLFLMYTLALQHYTEQSLSMCFLMVYVNLLSYYGCIDVKVEF